MNEQMSRSVSICNGYGSSYCCTLISLKYHLTFRESIRINQTRDKRKRRRRRRKKRIPRRAQWTKWAATTTSPTSSNAQTQLTTCRTKPDDYDKTWQAQHQQHQQQQHQQHQQQQQQQQLSQQSQPPQIIHATQSQQLQPICSTGVNVAQEQSSNTLRLIFANGVYYAPVIPTTYCTCNSQWTTWIQPMTYTYPYPYLYPYPYPYIHRIQIVWNKNHTYKCVYKYLRK